MENEHKDRRSGAVERHVQTAILGVLSIFAGWFANDYLKGRDENREVNVKLQLLTTESREFKAQTSNQLGQIQGAIQTMQLNFATRAEVKELDLRIREMEVQRGRRP